MKYEAYEHHGTMVWVRPELKGRHQEHCLCYACASFKPVKKDNCPIAQATYENCVKFGITTPMWECPDFNKRQ